MLCPGLRGLCLVVQAKLIAAKMLVFAAMSVRHWSLVWIFCELFDAQPGRTSPLGKSGRVPKPNSVQEPLYDLFIPFLFEAAYTGTLYICTVALAPPADDGLGCSGW